MRDLLIVWATYWYEKVVVIEEYKDIKNDTSDTCNTSVTLNATIVTKQQEHKAASQKKQIIC